MDARVKPGHDYGGASLLTAWAKEGRATALHDTLDLALAMPAWFTLTVIDLKIVLEVAECAVGEAVVAQRRAAGVDGVLKHRLNGIGERPCAHIRRALMVGDVGGNPFGRKPRAEQRLADIDIPEPADHALVTERNLE